MTLQGLVVGGFAVIGFTLCAQPVMAQELRSPFPTPNPTAIPTPIPTPLPTPMPTATASVFISTDTPLEADSSPSCDEVALTALSRIQELCIPLTASLADEEKRKILESVDAGMASMCYLMVLDAEMFRVVQHYLPGLDDDEFETRQYASSFFTGLCADPRYRAGIRMALKGIREETKKSNSCAEVNSRLDKIETACASM